MIYLPDKAPADLMDYSLDLGTFFPEGFSIDMIDIQIEDSGTGESPITLTVDGDPFSQPTEENGEFDTVLVFWLNGGTKDTRYQGRITISDNESSDPDRHYERLFQILVCDI